MTSTISRVYFKVSELPIGAIEGGRIMGLDSPPNRLKPLAYEGKVGTEMESFGGQYSDLHNDSIILGDELALWNAYLLEKRGKVKPTDEQRRVFSYLFDESGKGNVCDNAVNYNDHGGLKPKKGYSRAAVIIHPEDFTLNRETGLWESSLGEASKVDHLHLPRTGYVRLTNDGSYHPSGFPFDTAESRAEAEQSWTDRGFDPEFATLAVSYFWSRGEGQGASAVDGWYNGAGVGRFDVDADRNPDGRSPVIGRLPVSRTPSGARPASEDA